jgi:hypothetical protein
MQPGVSVKEQAPSMRTSAPRVKSLLASPPGVLTIAGNYVQQSDGGLRIEIAGFKPETEYDRLVVNGFATLDGRLTIESARGFLPPVGSQFNILGGLRSGQFSRVEGDLLPNGN